MPPIPVIDLFAGPGGLSEGFSSLRSASGTQRFEVRLSVEKDAAAHRTLELRSFLRTFGHTLPDEYYDYLAGDISHDELFGARRFRSHLEAAKHEAWHIALSEESHRAVSRRVRSALNKSNSWVLIGGPPCQAYSLAGRSRMRSANPGRFERDERHFLYREYLRIIANHEPPVFVMENVKGILSSTIHGKFIFERILGDLARPNGGALRYRVVPIFGGRANIATEPADYLARCEKFGIPQARHRVILVGVREDLPGVPTQIAPVEACPSIEDALMDLPPVRSRISKESDSHDSWMQALREACSLMRSHAARSFSDVASVMASAAIDAQKVTQTGDAFVSYQTPIGRVSASAERLRLWYRDRNLAGVTGHETRRHMKADLHRYLFAASFAEIRNGKSPKLSEFPTFLLPRHRNARRGSKVTPFEDRFRVQVFGRPSTTITSHIAKDGHYYIHPDPRQCRSLTLREAARLQTFPDNYHFEGTRTQKFSQVGNAVPPLLAREIAKSVWNFLAVSQSKRTTSDVSRESRLAFA